MAALILISACSERIALASEPTTAEAMFREGRQLLLERDYARACPLLSESQRLSPTTASLFGLAVCLEAQGKLSSALVAYGSVAERAMAEGRFDREKAAKERHALLTVEVSTLRVEPPPAADLRTLRATLDGRPLTFDDWRTPLPVDGGEHSLEVSTPGGTSFSARLSLSERRDQQVVWVPDTTRLSTASRREHHGRPPHPNAPELEASAPVRSTHNPDFPGSPPTRRSSRALIGAGVGGAGVALLGMGAVFALHAVVKNSESDRGCRGDFCSPEAKEDRLTARFSGNLATVALTAGAALTGAGATLFFLHTGARNDDRPKPPRLKPSVAAGTNEVSATFSGSF